MKKVMKGVWNMDKDVDLVHSPDEKGYYFKNYTLGKITKIYTGVYEATCDYREHKLEWK